MNTTTNTLVANFNSSNKVIAKAMEDMLKAKPLNPRDFRLSVTTIDDPKKEGTGQFNIEAHVVLDLLDTAYWELASVINSPETDDNIPLADRLQKTLMDKSSAFKPGEDGGHAEDEKRPTKEQRLELAVTAAGLVKKYAEHIAAVKGGGATWILEGFNTKRWMPVDLKDEEAVKLCADQSSDFSDLIAAGRVKKVDTHVPGRMVTFTQWCDAQRLKKDQEINIKNMMAVCKVADVEVHSVTTETALKFMGSWVQGFGPNKTENRLHRSVRKVANQKYRSLCWAIDAGKRNDIEYRMNAWNIIQYSELFATQLAELKNSDDYQDHLLKLELQAAQAKVAEQRRAMVRESVMLDIEEGAADLEIQRRAMAEEKKANEARRAAISAKLNPEMTLKAEAEEKAKAEKKAAAQAKAAATREAKKAAALAKANAPTKGIAGRTSVFEVKTPRRAA